MKKPSKEPELDELESESIDDASPEGSTLEASDGEPYSDEFLDAFLNEDYDDGPSYDFDGGGGFGLEDDAEFDSYFRNAYSHSRARRRRRHGGHRNWRDAFESERGDGPDWGYSTGRRPRR